MTAALLLLLQAGPSLDTGDTTGLATAASRYVESAEARLGGLGQRAAAHKARKVWWPQRGAGAALASPCCYI